MTTDQQISILWHACHGMLPPWAQALDVPVVAPFADIYADKLINDYDKELAEKLVSIGVSRGGLWSRCMAVRAIVEANPIPSDIPERSDEIQPTYFVKHPDGNFTAANPQPAPDKIDPNLSIEDVLKILVSEAGFSEINCLLAMMDDRYRVDCCNEECSWTGFNTDCSHQPHSPDELLCPDCHEVVEPVED